MWVAAGVVRVQVIRNQKGFGVPTRPNLQSGQRHSVLGPPVSQARQLSHLCWWQMVSPLQDYTTWSHDLRQALLRTLIPHERTDDHAFPGHGEGFEYSVSSCARGCSGISVDSMCDAQATWDMGMSLIAGDPPRSSG